MTARRLLPLLAIPVLMPALAACQQAKDARDGAQSIKQASPVNCVENRRVFELAVESYLLLENPTVISEADMVPDYIKVESPYFDLDAQGNIIPAPGSACATP